MALRSRLQPAKVPVKPALNAGLTLFVATDSVGSDWARLVLAEKDVDDARIVSLAPGEVDEDFLVLNPAQTLPALADREGVVAYARVIAEYLDERYPHPPLMPAEPAGRARVRATLLQIEQTLFPAVEGLAGSGARAADAAKRLLLSTLRPVEKRLAGGHFLGREYTLVDCACAVVIARMTRRQPDWLREAEGLRRYAARLFARTAVSRTLGEPGSARR